MSQAPRGSRRAARILLAVFVVTAAGTFAWGLIVVNGVRAKALETDAALRSVAWACLCYAQQERKWPASEAAFAASDGEWLCDSMSGTSSAWPSTRAEAMAGLQEPQTLAAALVLVGVEYPARAGQVPHIHARGNPSGVDTLTVINGWITAIDGARTGEAPTAGSERDS
ncbi:MAG: hypothetical protein EXS03_02435 [Phycisphaerales bacterium]|nr:hypothetical protein [Phycisphaerales bacterium]